MKRVSGWHVLPNPDLYPRLRGTGRTTGLMLHALGVALLFPDSEIQFFDHRQPHSLGRARLYGLSLRNLARALGIDVEVRVDGTAVYVRSTALEARQ